MGCGHVAPKPTSPLMWETKQRMKMVANLHQYDTPRLCRIAVFEYTLTVDDSAVKSAHTCQTPVGRTLCMYYLMAIFTVRTLLQCGPAARNTGVCAKRRSNSSACRHTTYRRPKGVGGGSIKQEWAGTVIQWASTLDPQGCAASGARSKRIISPSRKTTGASIRGASSTVPSAYRTPRAMAPRARVLACR